MQLNRWSSFCISITHPVIFLLWPDCILPAVCPGMTGKNWRVILDVSLSWGLCGACLHMELWFSYCSCLQQENQILENMFSYISSEILSVQFSSFIYFFQNWDSYQVFFFRQRSAFLNGKVGTEKFCLFFLLLNKNLMLCLWPWVILPVCWGKERGGERKQKKKSPMKHVLASKNFNFRHMHSILQFI